MKIRENSKFFISFKKSPSLARVVNLKPTGQNYAMCMDEISEYPVQSTIL